MNQQNLIIEYIEEHGYIIPARMCGRIYRDGFFGSKVGTRCSEMYLYGYYGTFLDREPWSRDTRFMKYTIRGTVPNSYGIVENKEPKRESSNKIDWNDLDDKFSGRKEAKIKAKQGKL